jgi:hypothetical protein
VGLIVHSEVANGWFRESSHRVQLSFRPPVTECGFSNGGSAVWAHRFILVGYLLSAVGAWMLVKQPARPGFVCLAVGATLQLIGGLLQH